MSKKNSAGTGSFYRRPNGTWQLAIMDGYKPNGKRNQVCFYGKTQKEAREKANKYFKDKADGLRVNEKTKFSDFADFWYEHHKSRVSETTAEGYKYTLKKVKEAFGDRYINSIKPYDVENALECLQDKGVADSSVRKVRGMMYQIFNKAEANDLIRKNPVRFAENIRARNKSPEEEAYTESEVKLLMNNLPDNRIGNSIRLQNRTVPGRKAGGAGSHKIAAVCKAGDPAHPVSDSSGGPAKERSDLVSALILPRRKVFAASRFLLSFENLGIR